MGDFNDFADLVQRMRDAQREYFRTRDRDDLVKARRLEARVDQVLDVRARQGSLFELSPAEHREAARANCYDR